MSDAAHKWTDKQIHSLESDVKRIYNDAAKQMRAKQKEVMAEYEALHAKYSEQYLAGDLSADFWNRFLNEEVMTSRWFYEMIDTLSDNAVNAAKVATKAINDMSLNVYAENYNWSTFKIEKGGRINTMFTLVDSSTVRRLLKENPQLLPQTAVKEAKMYTWNQRKYQSAIVQGVIQGESLDKIARRIASVTGMNMRTSLRNARTSMTAAQNAGRLDSYARAENLGIRGKKRWMATLDNHTRESHVQLDGESVGYNETFSNGLEYPGDPATDDPAEVYNCRCTMVYDIWDTDFSSMPRDNRLGDMSYADWKAEHERD